MEKILFKKTDIFSYQNRMIDDQNTFLILEKKRNT